MNVFLSHAISDKDLIKNFKSHCDVHGIKLQIAEHTISLDKTITDKIEAMIKSSAVAVFLLTKDGFDSKFVQQEIGYAKSQNIPSLYIAEKGIEKKITGFAYGRDYIILDPIKPEEAIRKAIDRLLMQWEENKRYNLNSALIITGIVAVLLFNNPD